MAVSSANASRSQSPGATEEGLRDGIRNSLRIEAYERDRTRYKDTGHTMVKTRATKENTNPLARRAAEEEARLRARLADAAALPSPEPRLTRAERKAKLEYQAAHGDEQAKRRADMLRERERNDAAERETLRRRRRRPHKHLPSGLGRLQYVASWGPPGIHTLLVPRHREDNHEPITDDLARAADVVRELFNFECSDRVLIDPTGEPPPRNGRRLEEAGRGRHVRTEIAEAIRLAAAVAGRVWISIAMELVTDSLLERQLTTRGLLEFARNDRPVGFPRPATSAKGVHAALAGHLRHLGLPLLAHVDVQTIEWMLKHLALGSRRGGGRTGKLNAMKMRRILADPLALKRELKRFTVRRR